MRSEVGARSAPRVVVSASLAHDFIMTFGGSFGDHILPDKLHVLSVSFLLDGLRRQRGGVAGNVAYTLALLGEPPAVVGAVGPDFAEYRAAFDELGIDTSLVRELPDELTAYAFMTADLRGNQIAAFYPGASGHAAEIPIGEAVAAADYGFVGATAPDAMRRHAEAMAAGCRLFYDPSQQIVVLLAEDLHAGIAAAWGLVLNDYELAMLTQKTGLGLEDLTAKVPFVGITYGAEGSELHHGGEVARIPTALPEPLVDPTGGGDAFRGGLIKGLLLGLDLATVGRLAALAATYAIERHGPQEHTYTAEEFVARFDRAFPDFAGRLTTAMLTRPAAPVAAAR